MNKIPFDVWWQRFAHCAAQYDLQLSADQDDYRPWYEQGLSPEEAIDEEVEAVAALVEGFDDDA